MTLSEKARALVAAAEKATAGPWTYEYDNSDGGGGQWYSLHGPQLSWGWNSQGEEQAKADAEYITTARNDAPDIARAYLEAVELVRVSAAALSYCLPVLPEHDQALARIRGLRNVAEAWLARHEAEQEG